MANHYELENVIWQNANLLRGPFHRPQNERIILPFMVLRRFVWVFEKTKAKVVTLRNFYTLGDEQQFEFSGIDGVTGIASIMRESL